jgi:hypothetical protein
MATENCYAEVSEQNAANGMEKLHIGTEMGENLTRRGGTTEIGFVIKYIKRMATFGSASKMGSKY